MGADKSIQAFNKLSNHIPSIGFLSRKKRIQAYISITNLMQQMLNDEELSLEEALFVLSLMMRKHHDFQKAASMVALNLASLGSAPFKAIGFQFANEMRKNMKLPSVNESKPVPM
jgi:hypothetical protein